MPRGAAGFEPTASADCAIRADATTLVRLRDGQVGVAEREQRGERVDGWLLARRARVDLEVEVRPGGVARRPLVADDVARLHQALRRVGIVREVPVVVGDVVEAGEPGTVAAGGADVA